MLRILISFVLSLVLTMTPILGQQLEQLQAARTSVNVSDVDLDKPVSDSQSNISQPAADNKINDQKNTATNNTYQYISDSSGVNSNTDNRDETNTDVNSTNADITNVSDAAISKVSTNSTGTGAAKQGNTPAAAKTIETSVKQNHPTAAVEQSKPAADKPTAISTEQSDPVPAGSGTDSKAQAAPAQDASIPKSTAAPVPQNPAPAGDGKVIDSSMTNSSLIGIRYLNQSGKKLKLLVEKDGTRYTYNLKGDNSLETFPLQSGNGDYKISILENTEGNKYRYILTETVSVNAVNANAAYLNSIQLINWNSNMAAIKKASEITSGVSLEEDKVKKIYNYIVSNVRYDTSKLNNLPSTYLPVIDETLQSKLGICYDFASLNAAMLRSVGIPAKLVMGYAEGVNGYHAWNEVYMGGKWITIDISYDSQMKESGASYSMKKDSSKYKGEKEY